MKIRVLHLPLELHIAGLRSFLPLILFGKTISTLFSKFARSLWCERGEAESSAFRTLADDWNSQSSHRNSQHAAGFAIPLHLFKRLVSPLPYPIFILLSLHPCMGEPIAISAVTPEALGSRRREHSSWGELTTYMLSVVIQSQVERLADGWRSQRIQCEDHALLNGLHSIQAQVERLADGRRSQRIHCEDHALLNGLHSIQAQVEQNRESVTAVETELQT
jgi:hypothetical protein